MEITPMQLGAEKSNELLEKQIRSYYRKQDRATILLGLVSLFFTVFLFILEKCLIEIRLFSIIPLILLLFGIWNLTTVIKGHNLAQGYNPNELEEVINLSINDIYKKEIESNKSSYEQNETILEEQETTFNKGVNSILMSIALSLLLLLFNFGIPIYNLKKDATRKSTCRTDTTKQYGPILSDTARSDSKDYIKRSTSSKVTPIERGKDSKAK